MNQPPNDEIHSILDERKARLERIPTARIALLNYSSADIELEISVGDSPAPHLWEMSDIEGAASDQVVGSPPYSSPWIVRIPAGRIRGFWTLSRVHIADVKGVVVTTAKGKDPWPDPPPPPPGYTHLSTEIYEKRFEWFLSAGGAPAPRKISVTIELGGDT